MPASLPTPYPSESPTPPVSVLLTGGSGFLGSFIADAIRERHPEWALTVLDVKLPNVPKPKAAYEIGDITNATAVTKIVDKVHPDVVIHTAGMVPELAYRYTKEQQARVYDINVNGTKNMLMASKKAGVMAFVWTGSCTAVTDDLRHQYPNMDERWPTSSHSLIYGESKAAAESLVLEANDENFFTCALRPSVLFGEGDHQLIPPVHACIAKGETPFVIGDGQNLWDVTYAGNIADAHVLAVENLLSTKTAAGEAIFLSNGQPISFRDFCLAVWAHFGHYPAYTVHIPVSVAAVVGTLAQWVTWLTGKPATLSRWSVLDAAASRYCTGEKARKLLGYKARIGIEEGLRRSCKEYAQRLEKS